MDDRPASAAWVNSKTVVEFLLEEEAHDSYSRELVWIRERLPKDVEIQRQMFRFREDSSIDMTLSGFTYLLACRRWPEGGYSADEYEAIAVSASKVFPAMAAQEKVKLAGARQRLNEGGRKLAAAGTTLHNQPAAVPFLAALKRLGGLLSSGSKQEPKSSGGQNMAGIVRPRP